ncbi:MAG: arginine--tRNA ligase [bacterium]|nr:arginine--tRNA ligase [bacterium]
MSKPQQTHSYQRLRNAYAAELRRVIKKLGATGSVLVEQLEVPPDTKLGDLAFPCFQLAKELKKSPVHIAQLITDSTKEVSGFERITAVGPYVNVFFDACTVGELALQKSPSIKKTKEVVVIEYISPNTNKPLHLGHVRNAVLGDNISRLITANGKVVKKTCLVNDRGIHICKSMIAYWMQGQRGKGSKGQSQIRTPHSTGIKGDHFVGEYYVLFEKMLKENPALIEQAQACLQKWEAGDKQTHALWKKMNTWVLSGMRETYARLGISFDKTYFESAIYTKGKDIILSQLKKGAVKKDETGAVFADLESLDLPNKILLRRDGTALYITQDIYLAVKKREDFRASTFLYVIGSEQDLYLKQLFAVLHSFGYAWAKNLVHISYGMVNLPDGKMKSREGTVVDADDILDELEAFATSEIVSRDSALSKKEVSRRAKIIALASIKFIMSDISPKSEMVFDPKESISFQGRTGPYILYTYARLKSIIRKNTSSTKKSKDAYTWNAEKELALHLLSYPDILRTAGEEHNPSLVARYLYDLAQKANDYYHAVPILKAEPLERQCRIALIKRIAETLKEGLSLLGIDVLEQM